MRAQPGDPDPVALGKAPGLAALRGHLAHHLVAWHDTGPARGEVTLDEVQVRPADAADLHLQEDLIGTRLGDVAFDETQRVLGGRRRVVERPSPHVIAAALCRRGSGARSFGLHTRRLENRGDKLGHVSHEMHTKAFENVGGDVVQIGARYAPAGTPR